MHPASVIDEQEDQEQKLSTSIFGDRGEAERYFNVPLIDFSPADAAELVRRALNEPPGRGRPLIGILRGTGGGKTRSLEEVKFYFLQNDENHDILSISITFNSNWDSDTDLLKKSKHFCPMPTQKVVFAIISRIASMVYGEDLLKIQSILTANFKAAFSLVDSDDDYLSPKIFAEFCYHIIEKVRSTGKKVTGFVLLIDEAVRIQDIVQMKDPYKTVRRILLQNGLENVNSALIISGLSFYPFHKAISERSILSLPVPQCLNPAKVRDFFWNKIVQVNPLIKSTDELQHQLLLMASLVNSLPRMVEIFGNELESVAKRAADKSSHLLKDKESVVSFFKSVHQRIAMRYSSGSIKFPEGIYLKALLYGNPIPLDREVMDLISRSSYTNVVSDFNVKPKKLPMLVPKGSFLFFVQSAEWYLELESESDFSLEKEIAKYAKNLYQTFQNALENPKGVCDGQLLEETTVIWTAAKLLAIKLDQNSVSLQKFLKVDDDVLKINSKNGKFFRQTILPFDVINQPPSKISAIATGQWMEDLGKQLLDENQALLLVAPKGERYDFSITIHLADGSPFTFFFDNKSRMELSPTKKGNHDWKNWDQYKAVYQAVKSISENDLIQDRGLLKSLKDGRFAFVYLTTYPIKQSVLEIDSFSDPTLWGPAIVLNREAAEKYFRVIFDTYVAIRSMSDTNTSGSRKNNS
jgi:hypothetical protein